MGADRECSLTTLTLPANGDVVGLDLGCHPPRVVSAPNPRQRRCPEPSTDARLLACYYHSPQGLGQEHDKAATPGGDTNAHYVIRHIMRVDANVPTELHDIREAEAVFSAHSLARSVSGRLILRRNHPRGILGWLDRRLISFVVEPVIELGAGASIDWLADGVTDLDEKSGYCSFPNYIVHRTAGAIDDFCRAQDLLGWPDFTLSLAESFSSPFEQLQQAVDEVSMHHSARMPNCEPWRSTLDSMMIWGATGGACCLQEQIVDIGPGGMVVRRTLDRIPTLDYIHNSGSAAGARANSASLWRAVEQAVALQLLAVAIEGASSQVVLQPGRARLSFDSGQLYVQRTQV